MRQKQTLTLNQISDGKGTGGKPYKRYQVVSLENSTEFSILEVLCDTVVNQRIIEGGRVRIIK